MRYHNDVKHAIFIQNEAVQSFALIMAYQSLAQLDYVNFFRPFKMRRNLSPPPINLPGGRP